MKGQCKPLSYCQRIDATTLILIRALKRKDVQLRKEVMSSSFLAWLMLPVAYVKVKAERLKHRWTELKYRKYGVTCISERLR